MNTVLRQAALAAALLLGAASASAAAIVKFTEPDNFADLPYSNFDREQVFKELTAHFNKLASKLPAGQDLRVEILDIDLAGRLIPSARTHELRVLSGGADWPHMRLRYSIEQDGKVLRQGEEQLSSMMYLDRISSYSSEPLRYEKQMLDDWFRKQVAAR